MKYFIFLLLFCAFANAEESIPAWLKTKISDKPDIQQVEKYQFNKKTVYLFMNTCCDHGFRELYNDKGQLICKLQESFAGLDDSQCPGFNKTAKKISNVFAK